MNKITVFYKDKSEERFTSIPTYGDLRKLKIRYEVGFVVITDSYNKETSIPSDKIDYIISVQ